MQKALSIVTAEFDLCEDAIEAVGLLMDNGLEERNISIIGRYKLLTDLIEDEDNDFDEEDPINDVISSLDNFDTFDFPTLDKVFIAGALIGKHKINGTMVSLSNENLKEVLKSWGLSGALVQRYFADIQADKTLVLALGESSEINRASSSLKYDTRAKSVDLFIKKQEVKVEVIDFKEEDDDIDETIDIEDGEELEELWED